MLCAVVIEQNNTPFCSKMDAELWAASIFFADHIKRTTAAPNRGAAAPQHPAKRSRILLRFPPEGGREGGETRRSAKKGRPAGTGRPRDAFASPCTYRIAQTAPDVKHRGGRSRRQTPRGANAARSAANERSESRAAPRGGSRSGT